MTTLLTEGQADSFALDLYPELKPAWLYALTAQEEAALWPQLAKELGSEDRAIQAHYLFGDQELPWCAGYAVGYHVVQSYLHTHPGTEVVDLLTVDPHEIYAGSGYTP